MAVQTPATSQESNQTTESTSADANDTSGGSVNTLPLFGERGKTAEQIDQEIHFLNDCDRNFTSRSEASDFFAARGWDYVDDGQLDTAAHRFNLSWLLNHDNSDAYWGLGVVCYQKNHLPDAIRMMRKGLTVADSNTVLMTDLATVEIKYYQEKSDADILADAETHLQKAVTINPNALSLQKLSVVHFLKADYTKAWDYFHQARSLDLSSLDLSYLNDLLAKHPDPKGVFK
ncbi:hypothetical protein GCM10028807_06160 [Spirosoma daeguense]